MATSAADRGGVRINLLPPEIIGRRKAESRRLIFVAIGLAVIAVMGIGWAFLALAVGIKTGEVASAQQQAANLRSQAESFKVFEDRGRDLQARQTVADRALTGRISWSELMGDLSLVLPPDVWIESLDANSPSGAAATLNLSGLSVDEPIDKANGGFKSVAQLLVRLNDLKQLTNVWLTSAEVSLAGFRGRNVIKFQSTSAVAVPASGASPSASSVPGKP